MLLLWEFFRGLFVVHSSERTTGTYGILWLIRIVLNTLGSNVGGFVLRSVFYGATRKNVVKTPASCGIGFLKDVLSTRIFLF